MTESIDIGDLPNRNRWITRNFLGCLVEAVSVCFENEAISSPSELLVKGDQSSSIVLSWPPADEAMRRTWKDEEVATEHGAYGIAFSILPKLTSYEGIERSRKGKGFDYWLGEDDAELFQQKARLEVSGIRRGSQSQVDARVRTKKRQISKSASDLPNFVVVVEFSSPVAHVENHGRS